MQSGANDNLSIQNLSWNNGDHGFDQLGATGVQHVDDVAYNNFRDGFELEGNSGGSAVHNCIAIENGITTNESDLAVDASSESGFTSDDNLFWNSGPQPPYRFGTTRYATTAQFSAATGQDTRTVQADPLFSDPSHGGFELRAGSPAIDNANSGVANWPSTDALTRARRDDPGTPNTGRGPVTFADRGALEFQAASQANQPPVARLTVSPSSGTAPLAVTTNASASSDADGTITSYRFDFGDGTSAGPQSGATATHTFAAGTWTVRVTVTDNGGATGTASATVTATAPANNQAPVARLTVSPSSGTAPLAVTANASASSDADGTITSYRFDFGDGTSAGPQSGATATHTFAAGTWTVRVTVTDNGGASSSASATVTATAPVSNQAPVAVLIVIPNTGLAPLPVVANGGSSFDRDGHIVSYRFDFGDGTVAGPIALATAAHVYGAGHWTLRLTVTDDRGATGSASVAVTVSGLPLLVSGAPGANPASGDSTQSGSSTTDALGMNGFSASGNSWRVSPDPIRTSGRLDFTTSTAGDVSIHMFDVGGRLVRTLAEQAWAPAGRLAIALDGRDAQGAALRRGIYFIRIHTPDGSRTLRFAVLR
jgi:PKD repeat protein